MDSLQLLRPTAEHARQIAAFRQEFLDNGDSLDGTSNLQKYEDVAQWLQWLETLSRPETCPKGFVPSSQYISVRRSDGRIVGMLNIRHALNDYLSRFGGHIGYCVRKSERRRGYAKQQLRLSFPECRKLGLYRVLITCADTNEASRRTILSVGGIYSGSELDPSDGAMTERYWAQVCKPGLLVQFPGTGYTCAQPLMLGCSDLFRDRGYDTVPLDYSAVPFHRLSTAEEALELARPLILERLAAVQFEEYADVVFLSKSFGTICAGWLAEREGLFPRQLYLTPVREALPLVRPEERVISMVLGDRDEIMDASYLSAWCRARRIPLLMLEGVGHSLKSPDGEAATEVLNRKIYALCAVPPAPGLRPPLSARR